MRISDWSSDVCSSDLEAFARLVLGEDANEIEPVIDLDSGGGLGETIVFDHPVEQLVDIVDHEIARGIQVIAVVRIEWRLRLPQIGRASCRERVCQYV